MTSYNPFLNKSRGISGKIYLEDINIDFIAFLTTNFPKIFMKEAFGVKEVSLNDEEVTPKGQFLRRERICSRLDFWDRRKYTKAW